MAYLLGDWATDRHVDHRRRATGYRRLISSMFDISPPTRRPATSRRGCESPSGYGALGLCWLPGGEVSTVVLNPTSKMIHTSCC